jgi:hypothetical protein
MMESGCAPAIGRIFPQGYRERAVEGHGGNVSRRVCPHGSNRPFSINPGPCPHSCSPHVPAP